MDNRRIHSSRGYDVNIASSRDAIPRIETLSNNSNDDTKYNYNPMIPLHIIQNDYKNIPKKQQSKGEAECQRIVEEMFGVPFETQVRLPELLNPLTKQLLEIDIYYENDGHLEGCVGFRGLGIEYHGRQHYEYVPFFHKKGPKDLQYQQWKDNLKVDLCDKHGIYLITVPYTVPVNRIKEYILFYLPDRVRARQEAGITTKWFPNVSI